MPRILILAAAVAGISRCRGPVQSAPREIWPYRTPTTAACSAFRRHTSPHSRRNARTQDAQHVRRASGKTRQISGGPCWIAIELVDCPRRSAEGRRDSKRPGHGRPFISAPSGPLPGLKRSPRTGEIVYACRRSRLRLKLNARHRTPPQPEARGLIRLKATRRFHRPHASLMFYVVSTGKASV